MATRREIERRRLSLRSQLREECRSGILAAGSPLPSVRELAERHDLSSIVVRQVLKGLEEEGVLYTVARVGTFVGRPAGAEAAFYLLLLPNVTALIDRFLQVKIGFEERIAQFGGASLLLTADDARHYFDERQLPGLGGFFDFDEAPYPMDGTALRIPHVRFSSSKDPEPATDRVSFGDEAGGRQAVQYLLTLGHRRIAFLGLNPAHHDPVVFAWSAERERGWRQVLDAEGLPTTGLDYHAAEVDRLGQIRAAYEAAGPLIRRPDITGVVAANDQAAIGLIEALRDAAVPLSHWPAIIGFDDDPRAAGHNVSSFRLPWDEIGRTAADLLWERRHGRLIGPPVHREVPMRLIRRFTCRANWSLTASHLVARGPAARAPGSGNGDRQHTERTLLEEGTKGGRSAQAT